MHGGALVVALVLGGGSSGARECANPPSITSSSYWTYIDSCGCSELPAPSRASNHYDRFMKACSAWRERNPRVNIVVTKSPATTTNPGPPECGGTGGAPSRASNSFWTYIDACGCANVDTPSTSSPEYDRFMKACSAWRERNPQVDVIVPGAEAAPQPSTNSERKP
jgi:hypothetical protein